MKANNTTSYRFLFVVASRESNPYLKFRETSILSVELQGRYNFACKDNGFCRFNKNKNAGSFQQLQIFGVNRTIKYDLFLIIRLTFRPLHSQIESKNQFLN